MAATQRTTNSTACPTSVRPTDRPSIASQNKNHPDLIAFSFETKKESLFSLSHMASTQPALKTQIQCCRLADRISVFIIKNLFKPIAFAAAAFVSVAVVARMLYTLLCALLFFTFNRVSRGTQESY